MLFILAIIQSHWLYTTENLAIDLVWTQYFHLMQPPPGATPAIEDVVD